jgi:hypothetical protein
MYSICTEVMETKYRLVVTSTNTCYVTVSQYVIGKVTVSQYIIGTVLKKTEY